MLKKRKTIVLCIVLASVVLSVMISKSLPELLGKHYADRHEAQTAFPQNGTYYCEILNSYLSFSQKDGSLLICSDAQQILFHVGYDGSFRGFLNRNGVEFSDVVFTAYYSWDQKSDILYLDMDVYPGDFSEDEEYIFVRIPEYVE